MVQQRHDEFLADAAAGTLPHGSGNGLAMLAAVAGVLIAARAVQGAGSALLMPLGLALLSAAFPPERRGAAIGIFSAFIDDADVKLVGVEAE